MPHSGTTRTGSAEEEWQLVSISQSNGRSWATGYSRPTHVLGEKEAIDFNVLFRDDTGV